MKTLLNYSQQKRMHVLWFDWIKNRFWSCFLQQHLAGNLQCFLEMKHEIKLLNLWKHSSVYLDCYLNESLQHSKTRLLQSFSPSLSHCRRRTLGTVCAESCGYGTMTGWTKLTPNEITLRECATPPGWGWGLHGGPPHFSMLGLWQADLQVRLGCCGCCWQSFHPWASRIYWADRAIANTLAQTGTGKRFTFTTLYFYQVYHFHHCLLSFCGYILGLMSVSHVALL